MHIVSITTDFGLQDYYVAELKAHIYQRSPDVNIVDVSHSVDSHDIVQAAHFVENVFRSFRKGSIHCIAVYNYYQKHSTFITFEREGHFFIGPDNGVFSLVFDDLNPADVYEIDHKLLGLTSIAKIIGWATSYLAKGNPISQIGTQRTEINQKMGIKPVVVGSQIRATIIHIDHYENVVINLKRDQFEKICAGRDFQIYYKQKDPIIVISENYSDVAITDVMCSFNTAGYMQIGINMGKASSMLNLNKNETIQINFLDR
ncbi:MAG: S-adenosylmethionine hydrolase [Halioglobus sp.]|jgi:S-adenosylmethionine hydrolase